MSTFGHLRLGMFKFTPTANLLGKKLGRMLTHMSNSQGIDKSTQGRCFCTFESFY